jgi:hypothetical protein
VNLMSTGLRRPGWGGAPSVRGDRSGACGHLGGGTCPSLRPPGGPRCPAGQDALTVERLSSLDTAFLCLDGADRPMHMGALPQFSSPDAVAPTRITALLAARADRIDRPRGVARRRTDPLRRLHRVRDTVARQKAAGPFRGPGAFPLLADWLPAAFHRLAARPIAQAAPLLFDSIVATVPLPDVPLHLDGAALHEIYPLVPIAPQPRPQHRRRHLPRRGARRAAHRPGRAGQRAARGRAHRPRRAA